VQLEPLLAAAMHEEAGRGPVVVGPIPVEAAIPGPAGLGGASIVELVPGRWQGRPPGDVPGRGPAPGPEAAKLAVERGNPLGVEAAGPGDGLEPVLERRLEAAGPGAGPEPVLGRRLPATSWVVESQGVVVVTRVLAVHRRAVGLPRAAGRRGRRGWRRKARRRLHCFRLACFGGARFKFPISTCGIWVTSREMFLVVLVPGFADR
jgi:hypothetical protein